VAVAQAQLAAAEKAYELVEARHEEDVKQAAAEIARAQSAATNARIQLSYATITAPIDGVIASVSTQEGETVAAGLNAPTFVTIIDLQRLQVDAYVDEVDIGRVRPGQEACSPSIRFPAASSRAASARSIPRR
jgi:HlyD family secretion protein